MELKPGMRVLDMGCGKALSSVFLAKEYGVQVWANDLWISATENWQRIKEAGMESRIFPIHAEAHQLPYADEFFDAIVSLDSYQYYGTDDLYLNYFLKFLKPGGQIGIVVAGLAQDFDGPVPEQGAEAELGCPAASPMMVAALQVHEVVKVLTGQGELLRNRMLFVDALSGEVRTLVLSAI